jgi:hypothetical protein
MAKFNPNQSLLFKPKEIVNMSPLKRYEILFSYLDLSCIPDPAKSGTSVPRIHRIGRPPVPLSALIKASVYKNLRSISTLSDLVATLFENLELSHMLGFNINALPSVERFSSFLRNTDNSLLQTIRNNLVRDLIKLKVIKGKLLSIDSCPISANVKENNLKTSCKDRFDKTKILSGDPDCRLGVLIHYPNQFKKEINYFWGYRNHVICDLPQELPVMEKTLPANVSEQTMFIPLFDKLQNEFDFKSKAVVGDSMYDVEYILKHIIYTLHAQPIIPFNPRRGLNSQFQVSTSGARICIAGFEMLYWGKFKDRGKERLKFVCPIIHSKKFRAIHPFCPWMHPKFIKGTGCTAYLRCDEDIRKSINYGSKHFKKLYNLRTGEERIFSRLLSICMQKPSVIGLGATSNHCTLAHITCLLVAKVAALTKNIDKIRFIKSFVKNL